MISLGEAGDLNSAAYLGPGATLPIGWEEVRFVYDHKSGVALGHYQNCFDGRNYLAIRGTWGTNDIMPALRVFLGKDPVERIEFVNAYIEQNFTHQQLGKLSVGGHSLGGLVAAAAAEKFQLPGLAQNSPGWMSRVPQAQRLSQFLQVRTARDVVADWGSNYPRNLLLPAPAIPRWRITNLHNLEHQNELIVENGLSLFLVNDKSLVPASDTIEELPQGQWARLVRAAGLWRVAHDYTYVQPKKNTPRP